MCKTDKEICFDSTIIREQVAFMEVTGKILENMLGVC
jgi:hypothetical protein